MPISEDEYEIRPSQEPTTMSKAELRKVCTSLIFYFIVLNNIF